MWQVGLKGKPPYLKGTLAAPVRSDDIVWTVEGGVLKIELTKGCSDAEAIAGESWTTAALAVPEGWTCAWGL